MTQEDSSKSYWQGLARSYSAIGAPLRPSREDIHFMEGTVAERGARHAQDRLRALLLGVTPEIAEMRWPEGALLTAADNSLSMMRAVWPGNVAGRRQAVLADWCALPVRASSCHVVIGDGSMNCVWFPAGFRALAESVRGVMCEGGVFLLRCFTRPQRQERPAQVFADVLRGEISSFHDFKFRLLMAMQETAEQGIAVDDVYQAWKAQRIDTGALGYRRGWDKRAVDTIELYRGKDTVLTFPTLTQVRSVLGEFFEELAVSAPSYSLSERCPILVLRPRGGCAP